MGASHDLRSRQTVSLDAPTPRGFGFGQGAERTETSAGNADCRADPASWNGPASGLSEADASDRAAAVKCCIGSNRWSDSFDL